MAGYFVQKSFHTAWAFDFLVETWAVNFSEYNWWFIYQVPRTIFLERERWQNHGSAAIFPVDKAMQADLLVVKSDWPIQVWISISVFTWWPVNAIISSWNQSKNHSNTLMDWKNNMKDLLSVMPSASSVYDGKSWWILVSIQNPNKWFYLRCIQYDG